MGYMIEIEKADAMELSKHIEKGLHHMGKAMQIAEELCGSEIGYRGGNNGNYGGGNTGYRSYGGYRGGMGYRNGDDETMYDEMGNPTGMRGRMRDSMGRYV